MLMGHPVSGKAKCQVLINAFIDGAPKSAVGHVFYGVMESNYDVWRMVVRSGKPYYFIDNSYFDQARGFKEEHAQFRVTKNALQCRAIGPSTGERFKALGIALKPWRKHEDTDHWVVIEQSEPFMKLMARDQSWLIETVNCIEKNRSVVVRTWSADKLKAQRTLIQDLEHAWCLVTHTSAAAVTALVHGIPAQVSTMHALAGLQFDTSDSMDGGRIAALSVLADNQWSMDAMRRGEAWAWLNR